MEEKNIAESNLQAAYEKEKFKKSYAEQEMIFRQEKYEEDEINIGDMMLYLRSKLVFMFIALVCGAIASFAFTKYLITPTYQASSYLYLIPSMNDSGIDMNAFSIAINTVNDYPNLIIRRDVLEGVVENIDDIHIYNKRQMSKITRDITTSEELRMKFSGITHEDYRIVDGKMYLYSAEELADYISVDIIDESNMAVITVVTTNPVLSQKIANELAEQAVIYIPRITAASAPTIAERAALPSRQYRPNYYKNTEIGGLLGLIIVGLIFIVKYLRDDSIKNSEDMKRIFGITPLTVIPEGKIDDIPYKHKSRKKEKKR